MLPVSGVACSFDRRTDEDRRLRKLTRPPTRPRTPMDWASLAAEAGQILGQRLAGRERYQDHDGQVHHCGPCGINMCSDCQRFATGA